MHGLASVIVITGWPSWKVQKISDQFGLGKTHAQGSGAGSRRYWTEQEIEFMRAVDAARRDHRLYLSEACITFGVKEPKWLQSWTRRNTVHTNRGRFG